MSAPVRLRPARLVVGAAVLVAGLFVATPAHAGPVTHEKHADVYDDQVWGCGYPIDVHGEGTTNLTIRADKKTGLERWSATSAYTETWSVPGRAPVTVSWNQTAKDLPFRSLGGSMYQGVYQVSGQPLVVRDSRGAVITKNAGNIRYTYQFDRDTGQGQTVDVRVVGSQPTFASDLCGVVAPYLGTDSARYLTPRPLGSPEATAGGMGYYEYLPPSYSPGGAASPLLVALNGYGENGDGSADALGWLQNTGIPRFQAVGGWPTDRPFVVLSTQHVPAPGGLPAIDCPEYRGGSCFMQQQHDLGNPPESGCTTPSEVHAFLAYAVEHYNVDLNRVYLTGLSCGAYGAWEYLGAFPGDHVVAAVVPIAGDGRPAFNDVGCTMATAPVWAFHSADDDTVDPAGSIEPIGDLRSQCGFTEDTAKLTIYDHNLLHGGWDEAYSGQFGDDIYGWMLAHPKA
ncbi:carboxylesterase family protein [Cellulomonas sp. P5_C6]